VAKKKGVVITDKETGEALDAKLTAEQLRYVESTFAELDALDKPLAEATDNAAVAKDAYDEAKDVLSDVQARRSALHDRMDLIRRGVYTPPTETKPMFDDSGDTIGPEEIPGELWETALRHMETCRSKGKGLSPSGLSQCLFGDRKKDHKARAEEILAYMSSQGFIERTETGKKEATYWPVNAE